MQTTLRRIPVFGKRLFSAQPLVNKSVLISGGLGDGVPPQAVSFLNDRGATVDVLKYNLDREQRRQEMVQRLKEEKYDALMVCLEDTVDEEVISASQPNVKCISTMSVGHNHINTPLCKTLGIRVGYTPDVLTETTADLVVGLTLATARNLIQANHCVFNGEWGSWKPLWMAGKDVYASKVGIIGMGRIGFAVAKRFQGFACDISYSNSSGKPHADAESIGCKLTAIDTLLQECDFVIPLCPLTEQTKHLFNDETFAKMKNDSMLINCSRGDVVDQTALAKALKSGQILGAGLDVTTPEPLPLDHELLTIPNCTILPHIGSGSIATRVQMALTSCQSIVDTFEETESKFFFC